MAGSHDIKGHDLRDHILGRLLVDLRPHLNGEPPQAVVAIPAKDEADEIGRCLDALAAQQGIDPSGFGVVLLVNNSSDDSAERARAMADMLPYRLAVLQADLPSEIGHAGTARRLAMDVAADWLRAGRVGFKAILTTDADTRVAPGWMAATERALAQGADAVAGAVALDPDDSATLTPQLRERGLREAAYEAILIEIDSLLDPIPHDPWPRHDTASGASLAVTLDAYEGIGGVPPVPLGEDRALAQALVASGWRLRHDPQVRVVTSGRLFGRATGGAADTIRLRNEDPAARCDPRLEPLGTAILRARWRGRLRQAYQGTGRLAVGEVVAALAVPSFMVVHALRAPNFAACWRQIENTSPLLAPCPLHPAELAEQIMAGHAALLTLRTKVLLKELGAARPDDNSPPALAAAPA